MAVAMEEWRPVVGYEGHYEISDLGRIRNANGLLLGHHEVGIGYWRVQLSLNGTPRKWLIHVLVAAAFIGDCPPGHECNHKNGNTADNAASNLEYLTRPKNMQHARDVLGRQWVKGSRHWCAKLTESDIPRVRELWQQGVHAPRIAEQFNVSVRAVTQLCHGLTWTHVATTSTLTKRRAPQGAAHPAAKLTEADVRAIRELRHDGVLVREIAARFSISRATVSDVCTRRSWAHI